MKIEMDQLIELLEKVQDLGNVGAIQEEALLDIHNSATRYHTAKGADDKASAVIDLDAAASINGERAASLNRAMLATVSDLSSYVRGLMTDDANPYEPTTGDLYGLLGDTADAMVSVRDELVKGSRKASGTTNLTFVDTAIDLLNHQIENLGAENDNGASAIEEASHAE